MCINKIQLVEIGSEKFFIFLYIFRQLECIKYF